MPETVLLAQRPLFLAESEKVKQGTGDMCKRQE